MMTFPNAVPVHPITPEGVVGWIILMDTPETGLVPVGVFDTVADAVSYGRYRLQHDSWDVMPVEAPEQDSA